MAGRGQGLGARRDLGFGEIGKVAGQRQPPEGAKKGLGFWHFKIQIASGNGSKCPALTCLNENILIVLLKAAGP